MIPGGRCSHHKESSFTLKKSLSQKPCGQKRCYVLKDHQVHVSNIWVCVRIIYFLFKNYFYSSSWNLLARNLNLYGSIFSYSRFRFVPILIPRGMFGPQWGQFYSYEYIVRNLLIFFSLLIQLAKKLLLVKKHPQLVKI